MKEFANLISAAQRQPTYVPLQVRYGKNPRTGRVDGWRVLTISILLNRTSRTQVECVLPNFFCLFPHAFMAEQAHVPWLRKELEDTIATLGFAHTRSQRVITMSKEWMDHEEWRNSRNVRKFTGCGAYAQDAFRIFVEHDYLTPLISTDRVLLAWKEHLALESARSAV